MGIVTVMLLSFPTWGAGALLSLVSHISVASLYLEVYSLSFMLAFSLAVLVSFSLLSIAGWVSSFRFLKAKDSGGLSIEGPSIVALRKGVGKPPSDSTHIIRDVTVAFVVLTCLCSVAFFGQWVGYQSQPYNFNGYGVGYNTAESNSSYYNVLFLPPDSIVKFSGSWEQWGRNPILLSSPKPALDTESSTAGLPLAIYIQSLITTSTNTTAWAKVMAAAGIKYVVLLLHVETALPYSEDSTANLLSKSYSFALIQSTEDSSAVVFVNLLYQGIAYSPSLFAVTPNTASVLKTYGASAAVLTPMELENTLQEMSTAKSVQVEINSSETYLVESFLPQAASVNLLQAPEVTSNPQTGWAPYQSTWWNALNLAGTLSNLVYTESDSSLSVQLRTVGPGGYLLALSVTLNPLSYPPSSGLGFSIWIGSQNVGVWNARNFPPWTTQTLLVPVNVTGSNPNLYIRADSANQTLAITGVYWATQIQWNEARNEASEFVTSSTRGDLSIGSFATHMSELNMSNFQLGNGPGVLQTSPQSMSYSFIVNKSQNYRDISQSLSFTIPQNWTQYNSITFSITPSISSGNYNLQFDIVGTSPRPLFVEYLRAFSVANQTTMVSISLQGIERTSITKIYFETGFFYPEYVTGEHVTYVISNLTLQSSYLNYMSSAVGPANPPLMVTSTSPSSLEVFGWNASGSGMLVVADSYAPGWALESLTGGPIGYGHMAVDGVFNGWLVESGARTPLVVAYTLQTTYFLLVEVSATAALAIVSLAAIGKWRLLRVSHALGRQILR
nr:hypothetical protein [Ferrimicrobium acidiphilum]